MAIGSRCVTCPRMSHHDVIRRNCQAAPTRALQKRGPKSRGHTTALEPPVYRNQIKIRLHNNGINPDRPAVWPLM